MAQDGEQKARKKAVDQIIDSARRMPLDHLYRIAVEQYDLTEAEQHDARKIPIQKIREAIEGMKLLSLEELSAYMVRVEPGDMCNDGWNLRGRYKQPSNATGSND